MVCDFLHMNNLCRLWLVVECALLLVGFTYCDIPSTTWLTPPPQLVGSSTMPSPGNLIQLVNAPSQVGAVWFATQQNVAFGFTATFTITVDSNCGLINPNCGWGDGIAFVLQNISTSQIGTNGEYMGYNLPESIAVEIDVALNTDIHDRDAHHVAVMTQRQHTNSPDHAKSLLASNSVATVTSIEGGDQHTMTITYTHYLGQLNITWDQTTIISLNSFYEISAYAQSTGTAYVGFTAATGADSSTIKILQFNFMETPEVRSVYPTKGYSTTTVTIHGVNFKNQDECLLNGVLSAVTLIGTDRVACNITPSAIQPNIVQVTYPAQNLLTANTNVTFLYQAEPDPPTNISISSFSTSLYITWDAPLYLGKPPSRNTTLMYNITVYAISTSFIMNTTSPSTFCTVAGLQPITEYSVEVASYYGFQSIYETLTATTTVGSPAMPNAPHTNPTPSSVYVWWEVPNNNGDPITGYTLEYTPINTEGEPTSPPLSIQLGNETFYNVTGLPHATEFEFRVSATNGAGVGLFSDFSYVVTLKTTPSILSINYLSTTKNTATLVWVADDGGDDITHVYVTLVAGNVTKSYSFGDSAGGVTVIANLLPNTIYTTDLQVETDEGVSPMISFPVTTKKSCGDGVCDTPYFENCVNCPSDCSSPCNMCGDMNCTKPTEDCTTCPVDCGRCGAPLVCPGTPQQQCTSHGDCVNGLCYCNGNWTGPACNTKPIPIGVVIGGSQTQSTMIIQINNSSSNYELLLESVQELSGGHGIGKIYTNFNFTLLNSTSSNIYQSWLFGTTLQNNAKLRVLALFFPEATTVNVYGLNVSLSQYTLKYSIDVEDWPFSSVQNQLQIVLKTNMLSPQAQSSCQNANTDPENSNQLLWYTSVSTDGYTLYAQFITRALIDGYNRDVQFSWKGNDVVAITVPFFWNSASIDPNYSVLVSTASEADCNVKQDNSPNLLAILLPSIGAALIVAAVVLGLLTYKKWKDGKKEMPDDTDLIDV